MKSTARAFLLFIFLFPSFSIAADLRVFFFSPTLDGARFRLQCVSSGEANRCPEDIFRARGKALCKESDMALSEIEPFNCVQDFEKSIKLCKYSNGKCSKTKQVQAKESKGKGKGKGREETQLEGVPGAQSLPSTEELPNVPSAEELPASLPEAESMPDLEDLPENLSSPAVE